MATETLYATYTASAPSDGELATPTNAEALDGVYTTNATGAGSPNESWTARFLFATPSGALSAGASNQDFESLVRVSAGGSSSPTLTAFLYENGTQRLQILAGEVISNANGYGSPGQVIVMSWDVDDLVGGDGADAEIVVTCSEGGGNPANRQSAQLDYVRWVVEYDVAGASTPERRRPIKHLIGR